MNQQLVALLKNTATTYARMLKKFRPCKPGGEFLEQNLVTLLSHEFLMMHRDGIAFTEVPFISYVEQEHWTSRIDAYLATDATGYLVEAKGSLNWQSLCEAIEMDLKRLSSSELRKSFDKMATGGGRCFSLPDTMTGVIIADCWSSAAAKNWLDNNLLSERYPAVSRLSTRVFSVGKFNSYEYFILAGQYSLD